MAAHAPAPQRTGRLDMAADREARCRMAPQTQNPSSLATRTLRRQPPKVGAVCGKAACTDLCGGTGVTRFPTAITVKRPCPEAANPKPSTPSAMPNDRRDTALVGRHNNRRPRSAAERQQTAAVVHSAGETPSLCCLLGVGSGYV